MKLRQILFSALCAVFALSCVEDATEDVYIGPEGQIYVTLSVNATSVSESITDDGTKVGFEPYTSSLYWTSNEKITLVDSRNSYTAYTNVTTTKVDDDSATFKVESFEVSSSATDIGIFATSGEINSLNTGSSSYCVGVGGALALSHDDSNYDFDTFGANLPFISPIDRANISASSDGEVLSFTDGVAPQLTMLPCFYTMNVYLDNLDIAGAHTNDTVGFITAAIELEDGVYFYDEIVLDAAALSYDNTGADLSPVNTAITTAFKSGSSDMETDYVNASVTYDTAKTFAELRADSELAIPIVSLGTTEDMTGKNFTIVVQLYDNATNMSLLAGTKQTYNAQTDFKYGTIDDVTPTTFDYDLDEIPAITEIETEAQGVITPYIKIDWEYPTDDYSTIAGVKIYYKETGEGSYEDPIIIPGTETTSYLLGEENESLDWDTNYTIYITTYSASGNETDSGTVTETTVEQVDIKLNGATYEIYTGTGLVAFAQFVNGIDTAIADLVTDVTNNGEEFPDFSTTPDSDANATVMTSISLSDFADWKDYAMKNYEGTFDGGNGEESGIKVTELQGASGLFASTAEGAKIQNLTLSGAVSATSNPLDLTNIIIGGFINEVKGTTTISESINNVTVELDQVDLTSIYGFVGDIAAGVTTTFTDCEDGNADVGTNVTTSSMTATEVVISQNSSYNGINVRWEAVADSDDVVVAYYSIDSGDSYTMSAPVKLSEGELSIESLSSGTVTVKVETRNYLWKSAEATVSDVSTFDTPINVAVGTPASDIVLNSGSGTYEIYTATGLVAFAQIVNGNNTTISGLSADSSITGLFDGSTPLDADSDANATIMADINMDQVSWTPMSAYAGTFDGGSESYFEIQKLSATQGLFASTAQGASISNINLVDVAISGSDNIGAIVGSAVSATIKNITISGSVSGANKVGAIAGSADENTDISNATNYASVTATASVAGALVGENAGDITDSYNYGCVTIDSKIYNAGTDSWLVGSGTAAEASCSDNYEGDGNAASLAEIGTIASAIPHYSDGGSSTIKVTYSTGNYVTSAKLFYKHNDDATYSEETLTDLGADKTVDLTITADQEYTIYISTYNYRDVETSGEGVEGSYATARTYGASTYDDGDLPTNLTIKANTHANVIVITWDTEGISEDLQEMTFTYNNETETVNKADFDDGTYTMTEAYNSGSATTITYAGYFAPTESSTQFKVEKADETIATDDTGVILINGIYQIYTGDGLKGFATIVNGVVDADATAEAAAAADGGSYDTVYTTEPISDADAKVMNSIALTGSDWENYAMVNYAGTFDGGNGGATNNGITITGLSGKQGLFASTAGAEIKNVSISVAVSESTSGVTEIGGLIGTATSTTISYCDVSGSVYGAAGKVGGFVGTSITSLEISNCTVESGATITAGSSAIGGFAGSAGGTVTLTNCKNYATIGNSASRKNDTAGLIGSTTGVVTITNCLNEGDIYGAETVGGILGYASLTATSTISNTTNNGDVNASSTNAGGFIGNLKSTSTLNTIKDCLNEGNVTSSSTYAGGIVGYYYTSGTYSITDTSNSGDISGTSYVGGVVGYAESVTISSTNTPDSSGAYNSGSVTATASGSVAGGIIGGSFSTSSVTNYTNSGNVKINDVLSNVAYGISGTDNVTITNCSDTIISTLGGIEVESVTVVNTAVTVAWSYTDDYYIGIKDITIYYKATGDGEYSTKVISTNGSNATTAATLYLAAGTTYDIYLGMSNDNGSGVATADASLSLSGDLSSTNPLTAIVSDSVTGDLVYTESTDTYAIYTANGLKEFANIVNSNNTATNSATIYKSDGTGTMSRPAIANASANAIVAASITNVGNWDSYSMSSYNGTFDGNNGFDGSMSTVSLNADGSYTATKPTVEGEIKITGVTGTTGFFTSTTSKAVIKNLSLEVAITTTTAKTGALTVTNAGKISYCRISGYITTSSNIGTLSAIAGILSGTVEYTHNYANVTTTSTSSSCTHYGAFGGSRGGDITINYCENHGMVSAYSGAGFLGYMGGMHTLLGCVNYGYIKGTNETAGIVNSVRYADASIQDCHNYGTINGSGSAIGGIAGTTSDKAIAITGCSNYGIVSGGTNVGGILGYDETSSAAAALDGAYSGKSVITGTTVSTSYNYGRINGTAATSVGGIIGTHQKGSLKNYINDALITTGGTLSVTLDSDGNYESASFSADGTAANATSGLVGSGSSVTPEGTCTDNYVTD